MLFCAKASIFKALYPIGHIWLGFLDAELTWRKEDDGFEAALLVPGGANYDIGYRLRVTCQVVQGLVLTTTSV